MSGLSERVDVEIDGSKYAILNGYAYRVQNGLNYFEPSGELEARLKEAGYAGPIRERIELFHAYGRQKPL